VKRSSEPGGQEYDTIWALPAHAVCQFFCGCFCCSTFCACLDVGCTKHRLVNRGRRHKRLLRQQRNSQQPAVWAATAYLAVLPREEMETPLCDSRAAARYHRRSLLVHLPAPTPP
jgi:hypothetical protein